MLKEGNIVKLSDENKYVVIKHLEYEGINYYYVFKATGEDKDFKILEEINNEYSFCEDKEIMKMFIDYYVAK